MTPAESHHVALVFERVARELTTLADTLRSEATWARGQVKVADVSKGHACSACEADLLACNARIKNEARSCCVRCAYTDTHRLSVEAGLG